MNLTSKMMWKITGWSVCAAFASFCVTAAGVLVHSACLRDPALILRLQTFGTMLMLAALVLVFGVLLLDLFFDDQPNGPAHMPPGRADDSGHVPAGRGCAVGPGRVEAPACDGQPS